MVLHETETRTQVWSNDVDDDYIDLEVNLSSSSPSSPPHSREFEFQMCSSAVASGESTTSPADELFYKGQLLPLHLPPRLQMVQKLLASSAVKDTPRAAVSSPRRFSSSEIVISEQGELKRFIENNKKIKPSSITQKLKASRAYIRALFSRQSCSDSSEIHPKLKLESINHSKTSRKTNPLAQKSNNTSLIHRRSFSGVIQRHCSVKSSSCSSSSDSSLSSSFSFGSNGSLDIQTLMRSSNASSEADNSIEGAIEHCKQSSRISVSICGGENIEKG